ncbi:hypothetical protein R6Q57_018866 [Mikania cordata]
MFKDNQHTIAEVASKAAYDTCNSTTSPYIDKRGGLSRMLDEPKAYYFFCTLHCAQGHSTSTGHSL